MALTVTTEKDCLETCMSFIHSSDTLFVGVYIKKTKCFVILNSVLYDGLSKRHLAHVYQPEFLQCECA